LPSPHGGWGSHSLRQILPDLLVSLVEDPDGRLWASTRRRGVFEFSLAKEPDGKPRLTLERADAQGQLSNPKLTLLGGELFVLAEQGIFHLERATGVLAPVPEAVNFLGLAAAAAGGTGDAGASAYWLLSARTTDSQGPAALWKAAWKQ